MQQILHITQCALWVAAKNSGSYQSDSLQSEGFIHCSTFAQVIGSANRFFYNQKDLVILVIDRDRVQPEIRYEGADANNLFPHIYGQLNIDAVVKVIDFSAGADGFFTLPPDFNPSESLDRSHE